MWQSMRALLMETSIQIPRVLQQYCARKSEVRVQGATVRQALDGLKHGFPELYLCICDETDAIRTHINIFLNDDILNDQSKLDTRLESGDVLSVFQAVSGG